MRRAVGATVLSLVLLTAVTGAAQAEERYAAAGNPGGPCTKAEPCSLQEAVTGAASNDEVIVTAGSYSTNASIMAPLGVENLYVHGDFGGPMPTISAVITEGAPISIGAGGRIGYLDVSNTGPEATGVSCPAGGRVDRVRASVSGEFSVGLSLAEGCVARDSLFRASGTTARAVSAFGTNGQTSVGRNLTAIATGAESTAVRSHYNGLFEEGSYTLNLANVIASGQGGDLEATENLEGPGHIVVSNSNFDVGLQKGGAKITGSANQTALPQFVNAAAGDYRQAAGSPTIDAGTTDQIGALDLAGNPRVQGSAPDSGAYEAFRPPDPPPIAAITSLSIAPSAFRTVNAGGAVVSTRPARSGKVPIGGRVSYGLSIAATVSFTVERVLPGRRVKGKCRKVTPANRNRRKCVRYKPVKGSFSISGAAGVNRFRFSGRIKGKALRSGRYRLVARVSDSVKRDAFRIVG